MENYSVSESSNSLLAGLLGKRTGLKPTKTKLTKSDGSVTILQNQGQEVTESCEKSVGFVVDLQPDLHVASVRPRLLLSSQDVPNDLSLLLKWKVTHILSLLPDFQLHPSVKSVIKEHLCLPIFDEDSFSLNSTLIKEALNFIKIESCNEEVCVLVHCNAGISRAPSVVILYLMEFEKLSFEEAYFDVMKVRPNAKPNEGFMKQLKVYKNLLTN